uniref:Leucine-rich repeat-containing N-terminal plant-type domain-containing protein n=1 Tax=Oryza nivara TaxID=4536 RepID=A0A0E0FGL6_ORYNI
MAGKDTPPPRPLCRRCRLRTPPLHIFGSEASPAGKAGGRAFRRGPIGGGGWGFRHSQFSLPPPAKMSPRVAQRENEPFLLVLVLLLIQTLIASSLPCLPDQAAALLQLKRSFSATTASATAFRSWRAGTDCCRWAGIRCDGDGDGGGRVTSLDLGGRRLQSGGLDAAVFSLTSLRYLNLGGNDFNASRLPATGFEMLTELTHLSISPPSFTGQIPAGPIPIPEESTDSKLDYSNNWFSSMPFDLIPYLAGALSLKVSMNNVSGEVPSTFCTVKSLRILDLSQNILNGQIPNQLASLHQLESLDLSSNKLSGEIPRKLASLDFLSTLNLSDNMLEGSIPESPHFLTLPNSSFIRNAGLCGPPLSNECSNKSTSNVMPHLSEEKSADIILFLFVGLGFGVGFAIAIVPR